MSRKLLERAGRHALLSLLAATAAACSTSSNALAPEVDDEDGAPPPPSLIEIAPAELPAFDGDLYKSTCQTDSGACPVVRWNGVDYVALSYRDNRLSFAIHAFDASGTVMGVREETGARYLAAVQMDAEARTVTFVGQAERSVTLTWDALEAIR